MNIDQEYSPKYWVVHNKTTYDVMTCTLDKSKQGSIDKWLSYCSEVYPLMNEDQLMDNYYNGQNLDCILVEIKMMELCK